MSVRRGRLSEILHGPGTAAHDPITDANVHQLSEGEFRLDSKNCYQQAKGTWETILKGLQRMGANPDGNQWVSTYFKSQPSAYRPW